MKSKIDYCQNLVINIKNSSIKSQTSKIKKKLQEETINSMN